MGLFKILLGPLGLGLPLRPTTGQERSRRYQRQTNRLLGDILDQGAVYGGYAPVDSGFRIPCPYCKEMILDGAQLCHFCHADLIDYMAQRRVPFQKLAQSVQDQKDFHAARFKSGLSIRQLARLADCDVRIIKEIEGRVTGQTFEAVERLRENFPIRASVERRLCDAIGFAPSGWTGSAEHAAEIEADRRAEYLRQDADILQWERELKLKQQKAVTEHLIFLSGGGQLTAPAHSSETTICPHCHRLISYPEWEQMKYRESRRCLSCNKRLPHMPKRPRPEPVAKKEDPSVRAREERLQREKEERLRAEQELGYEAIKCPYCSLYIPATSSTCPSCDNQL